MIIGTGIFVLTGEAAGTLAGPAIALSFAAAAIACLLAGLCYAEFAAAVPVAGSAYTFSYASLGELVAWIIGWDLMLELALGAATVASGWSQYFKVVLSSSPVEPERAELDVRRSPQLLRRGDRAADRRPAVLRGSAPRARSTR